MKSLSVQGVSVRYGSRRVVHEADLEVPAGSVFGLVGESGSGKSTLARAIAGLLPAESGRILLDGLPLPRPRAGRPSPIQMVFQNPGASLNPRLKIGSSIAEALEARLSDRGAREEAVAAHLELVGLPTDFARRRPSEVSGGQKQRAAIARAVAAAPDVLVADEITSALDLSVQASILNLVADLRQRLGLTILFISHNLAAVRYLCDTTAVMRSGSIVETAPSDQLVQQPREDYTRELLEALPHFPPLFRDAQP